MNRVALVGAGRMGRGLAHVFAWAGWQVSLIDAKHRADGEAARVLDDAQAAVRKTLSLMAGFHRLEDAAVTGLMARIEPVAREDMAAALAGADLIMEGVPETLDAKREALGLASEGAPDAVIASTTSTILSTDLAGFVTRPERFLNAHWLNPAFLIPVVEVSPHAGTDEAVVTKVMDWLTAMGKTPVRCAPSPGFIIPRIQALAMNEAARLVEEGVASADDIDRAIRDGFGARFAVLGLLEFIDWGGVDILHHASRYMTDATGEQRFAAPKSVGDLMAAGKTGLDAGEGYYDHRCVDRDAYRAERLERFFDLLNLRGLTPPPSL